MIQSIKEVALEIHANPGFYSVNDLVRLILDTHELAECSKALRHVRNETNRGTKLGRLNLTLIDNAIEHAEGRE